MKFWKVTNKTKNKAEILIYEQIGKDFWSNEGIAAKDFAADLKSLGEVKNIDIRINSPGGSVFEGLAIYNLLKAHSATKTVYVDGIAASIASVIAMAGDKIIMAENTMMMIHDPTGFVMGNAEDMRQMAETLEKIKESIIKAYSRTMMTEEEISEMMSAETWLTATEALEKGFADEVTKALKIAAFFDLEKFGYKRPPILSALNSMTQKEAKTMTLVELRENYPELYQAVLDEGKAIGAESMAKAVEIARVEGAEAERNRILSVKANYLPGHEELIEKLMFDGKTTGEQAAMLIVQAEKELRNKALQDFRSDSYKVPVVEHSSVETMKRKDFNNLSDDARRAFLRSGGKVID